MEVLVTTRANVWAGRRVFITGHTGFKGAWLALWLTMRGAEVTGYALDPPSEPSLFDQARVGETVRHVHGDVTDAAHLAQALGEAAPEIVFHLAAQSLVRRSYERPIETFAANVMGTAQLLDSCREVPSLRAIVCVTSDKCYENREWVWPYRESDPMGGHDPYSASKGAAELVIASWRRSYYHAAGTPLIASVRAGNVIGGGDWAADRLVPDIVRALGAGARPFIRNPRAVRPWQHVLDALGGYLVVAERLLAGDVTAADAWNFGPADEDVRSVGWVADRLIAGWGAGGWDTGDTAQGHEANVLKLDCSKARDSLGWRPTLALGAALGNTIEWYKSVGNGADVKQMCLEEIANFEMLAEGIGA